MRSLAIALALMATTGTASAHGYSAGSLAIHHPWARETAPGQTTGGGYMVVENKGGQPDRLISASSPAARQMQLHTMTMDGRVMRMREVRGGLAVPAHGSLKLDPGGMHLMFVGLTRPLHKGERIPATLRFQHAGTVKVEFAVEDIGFTGPGDNQAMPHMDHMGH